MADQATIKELEAACTDKERALVYEYIACLNATEAARRAQYQGSYETLRVVSSETLRKPHVKALKDALLEEKTPTNAELLAALADVALNSTLQDFITHTGRGFRIDVKKASEHGRMHLLKSLTKGPKGTRIELQDRLDAIKTLARIKGMLTERVEPAPPATEPMTFSLPADVIAPSFVNAYRDIRDCKHTEYLFYGGRGSTKSSFISLVIIWLIVNNPEVHALATRQVANTLRDSVYSQLSWAVNELGLADGFKCTANPLEITYLPTGQKIYFRGADDPLKVKSIKPPFGYIGILWFEELDQYRGPEAVRSIEQSAIRGGDLAYIFKSFNPPRTANNWANKYTKIPKASQYQHKSDYLSVPIEWLGKVFFDEAEHLKSVNPGAYEHEYLGVANSTGGLVFENVQLRAITDDEIDQFDRILQGVDWGFFPDPWQWGKMHYDAGRRVLYIFDELRLYKKSNQETYQALVKEKHVASGELIIADSAEPKSVADYRAYGLTCRGAEKGPESVKYSMKWLQGLSAIVIDPQRCPYSADEFSNYELEPDPNEEGSFISEYPDKNNHCIDAVRYATNLEWRRRGQ